MHTELCIDRAHLLSLSVLCAAADSKPKSWSAMYCDIAAPVADNAVDASEHEDVGRFESSSVILGRMAEAVDVLVTNSKDMGKVACRVMYRLAHHADTLYQGIVAQKLSSEWSTAQAVIKQKRQQVRSCPV